MTETAIDGLISMSPREASWYEYQVELIREKFNSEIEPLPIKIFKRRNAGYIGRYQKDKLIELHNKMGTNRDTLLHELTHAFMDKKYPHLRKKHCQEFWDLLKYLKNGGTTTQFYNKQIRQLEKKVTAKLEKKKPEFKISQAKVLLVKWQKKELRAKKAIKKLEQKIRRLQKKESE